MFHTKLSHVDVRGGLLGRIVTAIYGASGVTRDDTVYLASDLETAFERGDPDAIATIGHEISHVLQFDTYGSSMFTEAYLQNYAANRVGGMSDYSAYENIGFETAGAAVEQRISEFLAKNPDIAKQLASGGALTQTQLAAVSGILGQQVQPEDIRRGYNMIGGRVVLDR